MTIRWFGALVLCALTTAPLALAEKEATDLESRLLKHLAEVRVFRDKDGHVLMTGGRFLFWGSEKQLQVLEIRTANHKDSRLLVAFDDPRVQDADKAKMAVRFEAGSTDASLHCGPKALSFTELPEEKADELRTNAHYENELPAATPKPILLGQLSGTQTFLFVSAVAGSSRNPIVKIFMGPIRALETRASTATRTDNATVVKARDLTVNIGPGARSSGVKVVWQGETHTVEYLALTPSNLESVLGPKLYRSVSTEGKKTPCDWLLD